MKLKKHLKALAFSLCMFALTLTPLSPFANETAKADEKSSVKVQMPVQHQKNADAEVKSAQEQEKDNIKEQVPAQNDKIQNDKNEDIQTAAPVQTKKQTDAKAEKTQAKAGTENNVQNKTDDNVIRPDKKPRLQDDFYTNINYDYLKNEKLPEGQPSIDTVSKIGFEADEQIKSLIREIASDKVYPTLKPGSDKWKIATFYKMAADMKERNSLGIKPIEPYLNIVRKAKDINALNNFMVKYYDMDYAPFISMAVGQDRKDSSTNILYLVPMKPELDKSYFKNDDEFSVKSRKAFSELVTKYLMMAGNTKEEAQDKTKSVMEFEEFLAGLQKDTKAGEDLNQQYHVITLRQAKELTKPIAYNEVMKKLGFYDADKIVATDYEAIGKISNYFSNKNIDILKAYLEFSIINKNSSYLSREFSDALSQYARDIVGVAPKNSDEELALELTNTKFKDILGKLYVEKYFNPEIKTDVNNMIKDILAAYKKEIANSWLNEKTKESAYKKIDSMVIKVGYPDKWKNFDNIVVEPYSKGGTIVDTIESINKNAVKENAALLNKPVDKTEWQMQPQVANAYYNAQNNEIVFTAAIMQPPVYSLKATEAQNLGAAGAIIGHEISHAFDSTGAQFDYKGNLNNWWTENDYKVFQTKVKKAADTFSKLEVLTGYHVNGEISTGEILADLGGLNIVTNIAKEKGLNLKDVYDSYARIWARVGTKEAAIIGITDEHPYNKFRVNSIVNMIPEFYDTYNVKPGDKMYVAPKDRLTMWKK